MASLIQEFIASSLDLEDDLSMEAEEMLLNRRLSPYATLRQGDLAALLHLHSPLSAFPGAARPKHPRTSCGSHHDLDDPRCPPHSQRSTVEDEQQWRLGQQTTCDDGEDECFTATCDDVIDVVCRGTDCSHVPIEYLAKGLRRHEMPVIGVYIDNRICPGFRYRVRRIAMTKDNDFLFENEAKTLESVGMGYGRRLTFTGDSLNHNDCFFWSDGEPNGFAFSIQTVDEGQRFSILDADDMVVGEGVVVKADDRQEELSSQISTGEARKITKRVRVRLVCELKYHHRHHHGLVELMQAEDMETVLGEAVVAKERRSRKASLVAIENVCLPRFGRCRLVPDA